MDQKKRDIFFDITIYTTLILISLFILLPVLYVFLSSFASKAEIYTRGFFIIPNDWTFDAYGYLLTDEDGFVNAFKNAVIITVIGVSINMVLTSLMAYGLSKRWLLARSPLNFMVIFTMLFQGGMIPTYLVISELDLLNSYWSLWLVHAIAPFNLIIMRGFFQSIPGELEESARIDGCGEFGVLTRIVLPLSTPVLATITLFYTVMHWNTYFQALLYLTDSSMQPLQVFLRSMVVEDADQLMEVQEGFDYGPAVKNAAIFLTAVPLLVVYPFLQKYFNKGMLLGSVKG